MLEEITNKIEKGEPVGELFADLAREAYEETLRTLEVNSSDS